MIYLETERLIIRDHRWEDLSAHHELLSNSQVMHFLPELKSNSLADSRENLTQAIAAIHDLNRQIFFFGIFTKEKQPVGEIGYTVLAESSSGKHVEVGYFLRPEFEGQGYMTEAFTEVLRYAFFEGAVFRILCGCLKENIGSEKVMQKCALIKEGEFKQFQLHEGVFKDRVQYRLLKTEYMERLSS